MKDAHRLQLPILLVDDESQALLSSSLILRAARLKNVLTIEDARQVLPLIEKQEVGVIVLDLSMPFVSGIDLLSQINQKFPHIPVIVMTAMNELETAVECMKAGAFDYLVKPVEKNRFVSSVKRAIEMLALRYEVSSLKRHLFSDELEHEAAFSSIITKNKKMHAIFKYIEAIAVSQQPVLITGETGVGKELVARSIHELSGRKGEFITVNIAGLDDNIFSDTLFGHKKGAYTGAEQARDGLIARASSGTLFLDEIGDMNELSQVKLLRLLQEQTYYQLGSDVPKQTDARIVVATNQNPETLISEKKFRNDLYFRLSYHHIQIPPLRERLEDIPLLLDYFLENAAKSLKKKKPKYPLELITLLKTYHFPGNIRELQAMVFDAVAQHQSGVLSMDSFKKIIGKEKLQPQHPSSHVIQGEELILGHFDRFPTLEEVERFLISEALNRSNSNQGIAASLLGITRQALNKRLKRKNILASCFKGRDFFCI